MLSDARRHAGAAGDVADARPRAPLPCGGGARADPAAVERLAKAAGATGAGQSSGCPSAYDLEVVREVILVAEERARREYARGSGGREITLLKLLRAYEQVRWLPWLQYANASQQGGGMQGVFWSCWWHAGCRHLPIRLLARHAVEHRAWRAPAPHASQACPLSALLAPTELLRLAWTGCPRTMQVLPRHGVIPEEDIHYYRILLRLSLDPDPDWWSKFDREAAACDARCADVRVRPTGG